MPKYWRGRGASGKHRQEGRRPSSAESTLRRPHRRRPPRLEVASRLVNADALAACAAARGLMRPMPRLRSLKAGFQMSCGQCRALMVARNRDSRRPSTRSPPTAHDRQHTNVERVRTAWSTVTRPGATRMSCLMIMASKSEQLWVGEASLERMATTVHATHLVDIASLQERQDTIRLALRRRSITQCRQHTPQHAASRRRVSRRDSRRAAIHAAVTRENAARVRRPQPAARARTDRTH